MPRFIMSWTIDLIGANPVPVATSMIGLAAVVAKEKFAEWKLDIELVGLWSGTPELFREAASRHMANMDLGSVALVRRIGHGEVAAVAVGHDHPQILPGAKFGAGAAGKRNCRMLTSGVGRCRR